MKATLIISSCDAYSDCWLPMVHSLHQHWPGCPYPVALICNSEPAAGMQNAIASFPAAALDTEANFLTPADTCNNFSLRFLNVGPDRGWGPNLALALSSVETEFVIYLQEDYFLDYPVNTEAMEQHLEYCRANGVDYLRLGWPWQDRHRLTPLSSPLHDRQRLASKGSPLYDQQRFASEGSPLQNRQQNIPLYCDDAFSYRYALCLQPAIWRTQVLKQLSSIVNDGWEFERKIKQYILDKQLSIRARVIHSSAYPAWGLKVVDGTGIRKGLWTRGGERYLNENGFGELVARRGVEGALTDWLMHREFWPIKLPAVILLRIMKKLKVNW